MLDIHRPRAVLEINSWLPELKSGEQRLSLNGCELPCEVGATLPGAVRALCLAPGHWLLVSEEQSPAHIAERFAAEVAAQGAVLIDTTDGIGVLNVRGALARDVLSKCCGLDFHSTAFAAGGCARTRFAQMAVIVEHIEDATGFRLYVARSYVRFLTDWIADAAVEFQSSP
jgi:sarcosine oxidase subunit gamma